MANKKGNQVNNLSLFGTNSDNQLTPFNTLAQPRTNGHVKIKESENQPFAALGGAGCANTFLPPVTSAKKLSHKQKAQVLLRQTQISRYIEDKRSKRPFFAATMAEKMYNNDQKNRREKRSQLVIEKKRTKIQLRRKLRDKAFSYEIALNLLNYNFNSQLNKSYMNTLEFCQREYIQDGRVLTSKYCNNRHCYSCNRIRTAKLINNYLPVIENLREHSGDLQMVTLTIPNVKNEELQESISQMIKVFQKVKDTARKHFERTGVDTRISGLRKLECTYNTERKDYHPHFHLLVNSEDAAWYIVDKWLGYFPNASFKAQDVRPADNNSVKEMFKYFTKFWQSKQELKIKKYSKITSDVNQVDYVAMNNIFLSIRGKRIFQGFGLENYKIDESEELDTLQKQVYNIDYSDEQRQWKYMENEFSYLDFTTGELILQPYFTKKDALIFVGLIGYDNRAHLPTKSPNKTLENTS